MQCLNISLFFNSTYFCYVLIKSTPLNPTSQYFIYLYTSFLRGPRFCVTHSTAIETASAKLKYWHTCQERPRVDTDPFPQMVSLLPLTTKSCMPRIPASLPQVGSVMTLRSKPGPIKNSYKTA